MSNCIFATNKLESKEYMDYVSNFGPKKKNFYMAPHLEFKNLLFLIDLCHQIN